MATLQPRSSGYELVTRDARRNSHGSLPKESHRNSVISGFKSLFASKATQNSVRSQVSTSSNVSYSQNAYADRFDPIQKPTPIRRGLSRCESVQIKTSDSFPVLSPQLEERMLQLADRSRRLGVHRFSRTSNALIMNFAASSTKSHGQVSRVECSKSRTRSLISSRFLSGGSSTSLSTQGSTPYCGSIQKVPKVLTASRASVRE